MWIVNDFDNFKHFIEIFEANFENYNYIYDKDCSKMEDIVKTFYNNYGL